MKKIKYQLCTEINHGTEDDPQIEQTFSLVTRDWTKDAEASAAREAYNGEYTIEDDGQPEPVVPPTTDELAAENKLLKQQVSALTDQNDFQEDLIVELANVIYA